MKAFGLELEESKTRLIRFGRFATLNCLERNLGKPETFTFLGFTHYCSLDVNGRFRVKRKTSRKKFSKKCRELNQLISEMRNRPIKDIIKKLNQILVGYDHYYGITDNSRSLANFHYRVQQMLFYWLNKRSQRKSYTWETFNDMLKVYPLVKPRIYVSIFG